MNSTSDIVDELQGIKDSINITNVKQTKTIDDILKQNIENIENIIDSKVINIYARPWSKLELKLKIRKIDEYFLNNNDDELFNQKKFITKYLNDKKKVVVDYSVEECKIKKIQIN